MSTLTIQHDVKNVPEPIVQKLRSVVRRARTVVFVRGILAVVSVALIALLVGMAIDSSFAIFSTTVRAAISITLLSIVVLSAILFLVRPLLRSYNLTSIARMIETRHPELEERLSSAIELLSSKESTEIRGSEALIAAVAEQAVGQVDSVSPRKEYNFAAARPYLITTILAALVLGLLFACWPDATTRLFKRIVAPFANIGNVHATDVVVTPGDVVIANGDSLRIEVVVPDKRVTTAKLRRRASSVTGSNRNKETVERMKALSVDADGKPRFFLSIPTVSENFEYRIHVGGAITRHFSVNVVPRPEVDHFEIAYDYPEYINRDTLTEDTKSGDINAPVGTSVSVTAFVNSPLKSATMAIAGLPAESAEIKTDDNTGQSRCHWELTLGEELTVGRIWTLRMQEENGFQNWPAEYTIKSLLDKPPAVEIVSPAERELRMKRTDTLPIQYRVEDDYGIASVELIATVDGGDEISRRLSVPTGSINFQTITNVELSKLAGRRAQEISLFIRAHDGLPFELKGPQLDFSETITIKIDRTAESYFEKTAAVDYAGIREQLEDILEDLKNADQATSNLNEAVAMVGRLSAETTEKIDTARDLSFEAQEKLRGLGEVLPQTSFAALTPEVLDLAVTDVAAIREQAGLIKLNDEADRRSVHALAADRHVDQSIKRTEKLIEDLDDLWEQIQKVADLKDLAAEQKEIAAELVKVDLPKQLPLPLEEMQLDVIEGILETLKEDPAAIENVLETKQREAEDLVETAKKLAEDQKELSEITKDSNQPKLDPEKLREMIAEEIARKQEEIAAEAAQLDEEIEQAHRAGEDQKSNLEEKPDDALKKIEEGKLAEAQENAEAASEDFENAAAALARNEDVPDENEDSGENSDSAKEQAANEYDDAAQGEQNDQGKPEEAETTEGDPAVGENQIKPDNENESDAGQREEPGEQGADPANAEQQHGEEPGEQQGEGKQPESKPEAESNPEGTGEPETGQENEGENKNDPQRNQELAEKAADLAERQENVAEQLEALTKGELDKALELMQKEVAEQTEEVAAKAQAVADLVEALEQKENRAAEKAEREFEKAIEATRQAEGKLGEVEGNEAEPAEGEPAEGEPAEGEPAEGEPAEGEAAEGEPAEGESAEGEAAEGEAAEGEAAEGEAAEGEAAEGEAAEGEAAEGEAAEGEAAEGEPAEGEPAEGEPAEGEPAEGESAEGEAAEGEAAEGQAAEGEPAEAEAGEGESAEGEPAAGEPAEPSAASNDPAKREAVKAQRAAARALDQAARALEDLAEDLGELASEASQAEATASAPLSEEAAEALGEALDAASQASGALEAQAAAASEAAQAASSEASQAASSEATAAQAAAAENAQQAAEALTEAAQVAAAEAGIPAESESGQSPPSQGESEGEQPGEGPSPNSPPGQDSQGPPSQTPGQNSQPGPANQPSQGPRSNGESGNEGATDNQLQQELKDYGISAEDWDRLPGKLKNKIRQAEADGVPPEYRAMVKRYFRELARRGSKKK